MSRRSGVYAKSKLYDGDLNNCDANVFKASMLLTTYGDDRGNNDRLATKYPYPPGVKHLSYAANYTVDQHHDFYQEKASKTY